MKKKIFFISITIVLSLIYYSQTFAWTEETHMDLSQKSAENSLIGTTDYLKNPKLPIEV